MRSPSARQAAEQYTRGFPGPPPVSNERPHTRHLAAFAAGAGRGRRRIDALPPRAYPSSLHASEQYRMARLGVRNVFPHARHSAVPSCGRSGPAVLRLAAYPLWRHASEQYRTARLGVRNALPHALHRVWCTRAASLAALALHGPQ